MIGDLMIVELRGGDAGDSTDAVCVDLDPGSCTRYEWRALVRVHRIPALVAKTGATLVGEPKPWDGSAFGDGNGGTVEWINGDVVGDGLYAEAMT